MTTTPSGQQTHFTRILQVLGASGAMSRAEIAKRVGISRTTLSELTSILLERGAIIVSETDAAQRTGRGRPAELLTVDPTAGQFMGVDFGRTRIQIVVANAAHDVIASDGAGCSVDASWPDRVRTAMDVIDRMAADGGIHFSAMRGVGVGFPGPLSPATPRRNASDAGDLVHAGDDAAVVRSMFEERFGGIVIVDNNTRFAALAEASWGRRDHTGDLLYLRLAGGVGGGLVIGGRLVSGSSGFAGELGHVPVAGRTASCHCGKRGCLETVASIPSLLKRCEASGVHTLEDLRAAAAASDPLVSEALREAGTAIGEVLGTAAVTLNPAEIVLAGDLIDVAPELLRHVRRAIGYQLLPMLDTPPEIRRSDLGEEAGALGALVAVLRHSPLLIDYPNATPEGVKP